MSSDLGTPRQICLWGPVSAGKTALLAQLVHAAPLATDSWEVLPAAEAQDFVESTRHRMREQNRFPAATTAGGGLALAFHFRHRRLGSTATLAVEDRAGDDSQAFTPLGETITRAEGLVMLLDSTYEPAVLEGFLLRTLERLSYARGAHSGRDPRPIAVCLSKADLYIQTPDDLASASAEPDAFVRRRLDERCLAPLATYCERFQLFPVSAIGLRLRWGAIEPVVFVDESGTERLCPHTTPLNLLAPFTWVLDQLQEA